jgi:hypothetical protein
VAYVATTRFPLLAVRADLEPGPAVSSPPRDNPHAANLLENRRFEKIPLNPHKLNIR